MNIQVLGPGTHINSHRLSLRHKQDVLKEEETMRSLAKKKKVVKEV
jgi:hypothetical protein